MRQLRESLFCSFFAKTGTTFSVPTFIKDGQLQIGNSEIWFMIYLTPHIYTHTHACSHFVEFCEVTPKLLEACLALAFLE